MLLFGSIPKARQKVNNSYSVGVSQTKGTLTLTHVLAINDLSRYLLVELEEAWKPMSESCCLRHGGASYSRR